MKLFGRSEDKEKPAGAEPVASVAPPAVAEPPLDLTQLELQRDIGALLRPDIARKIQGIAIDRQDGQLFVAVVDPMDPAIYDLIDISTNHEFRAHLKRASADQIKLAQDFVYNTASVRQDETWKQWLESKSFENEALARGGGEVTGEAVALADQLIKEAISVGASDIHLEMFADSMRVRYRQDGLLRVINDIRDLSLAQALIKRLKVMANMDITQDRVTQGGRISVKVANRGYDLRVSIVPVPGGESVVMRLLSKGAFNITLEDLGFSEEQLKIYRWFIGHPHGLILTSGPTGSGKSTTLYASLKSIARPDRKLLTVEDPIEYEMPGIIQVQTNSAPQETEKRVTFASALREFLRQDPDVILVGEIRDTETANISLQAALTGHLVLSTIHTNDAVGIVNRLKNQGVPSYLIASTLIGGVAQRLIRRLCAQCKEAYTPDGEEAARLAKEGFPGATLYRAVGCDVCRGSGYKGRVGLYEILAITDELRELIEAEATAMQIRRAAQLKGMKSLRHDGIRKASMGLVSLSEVDRVCQSDID